MKNKNIQISTNAHFCSIYKIFALLLFVVSFSLYGYSQTSEKSIALIVDADLENDFTTELETFISDLEKEHYNVVLHYSQYQTPEEVRSYLQTLYNTETPPLLGAILFGNIPLAYQYFMVQYTNPNIETTYHKAFSLQFFSDLDGTFLKDDPEHPDCYTVHNGNIESDIWVSILPWFTNENTTITKIKEYLHKNHAYRSSINRFEEGFLDVSEHRTADDIPSYNNIINDIRYGQYSWQPFTEWGNVSTVIFNSIGEPSPEDAYNTFLQSTQYRFASLAAHGNVSSNGLLSISDLQTMSIKTPFVWLGGCNTANLDYDPTFATSLLYNTANTTLIVKGGSTNVGGLGNNENGFFGKNIATAMLNGKSIGEAFLYHNNTPLAYPWSINYELHFAACMFVGDLSLTLFQVPDSIQLITPLHFINSDSLPILCKWNTTIQSKAYQLQVASNSTFETLLLDTTINDTSFLMQSLPQSNMYFWRVRGINPSFIGTWTSAPSIKTQTIHINGGWNLISTNIFPENNNIESIIENTNVTSIKTSDTYWIKNKPINLNTLHSLEPGVGYMVHALTEDTLLIEGVACPEKTLQTSAKTGWQLLGCPFQHPISISEFFSETNFKIIKNFEGAWSPNGTPNGIEFIEPGGGYLIFVE